MKPLALIVENDPSTRLLLAVFAERAGAEVDAVASGLETRLLSDRVTIGSAGWSIRWLIRHSSGMN